MTTSRRQAFWAQYIANMQLECFAAYRTKVSTSWRDDQFTPNYHRFYYIIDGTGFLKIDDQVYYPKPGELYLLPAGREQSYGTLNEHTFDKYWCHFTAKVGNFDLLQLVHMPIHLNLGDHDEVKSKFIQMIEHYHSDQLASQIRVHAALFDLLALFIEQGQSQMNYTSMTTSLEKMDHVLKYIEKHLSEQITIEQLANIAHFHPNYFIRVFKETTGLSPIQYINRSRLDHAKQLLTHSANSVSEIAASLGLELAYFSRIFKENTGFSPSSYREMIVISDHVRK